MNNFDETRILNFSKNPLNEPKRENFKEGFINYMDELDKVLKPNDLVNTQDLEARIDFIFTQDLEARIDFIFVNQFIDDLLISTATGDTPSALEGFDHRLVDGVVVISNFLKDIDSENGNEGFLSVKYEFVIFSFVLIAVIGSRRRRLIEEWYFFKNTE